MILTTFGRSCYLRPAMESGAVGFLLKDAPSDQLAVAIRHVMAGERVVDPDLALSALSDGDNKRPRQFHHSHPRDWQTIAHQPVTVPEMRYTSVWHVCSLFHSTHRARHHPASATTRHRCVIDRMNIVLTIDSASYGRRQDTSLR